MTNKNVAALLLAGLAAGSIFLSGLLFTVVAAAACLLAAAQMAPPVSPSLPATHGQGELLPSESPHPPSTKVSLQLDRDYTDLMRSAADPDQLDRFFNDQGATE